MKWQLWLSGCLHRWWLEKKGKGVGGEGGGKKKENGGVEGGVKGGVEEEWVLMSSSRKELKPPGSG